MRYGCYKFLIIVLILPNVLNAGTTHINSKESVTNIDNNSKHILLHATTNSYSVSPNIVIDGPAIIFIPDSVTQITGQEKSVKHDRFAKQIKSHYTKNFFWYGAVFILLSGVLL